MIGSVAEPVNCFGIHILGSGFEIPDPDPDPDPADPKRLHSTHRLTRDRFSSFKTVKLRSVNENNWPLFNLPIKYDQSIKR